MAESSNVNDLEDHSQKSTRTIENNCEIKTNQFIGNNEMLDKNHIVIPSNNNICKEAQNPIPIDMECSDEKINVASGSCSFNQGEEELSERTLKSNGSYINLNFYY